jgi:hypothetical protein
MECGFKQELSVLFAHHNVTNFSSRAAGGYLLEIDFSELVSKWGGKSFSVVALVPQDYPNTEQKLVLMPVDRDGSVGRDLLFRIGENLIESAQVAPGCPAILCAISGVACILRDATAEDNGRAICEKAEEAIRDEMRRAGVTPASLSEVLKHQMAAGGLKETRPVVADARERTKELEAEIKVEAQQPMQLTQFMQSEQQLRKRSSELGSSSADTTASSCRSMKRWIAPQASAPSWASLESDSSDSDSSADTISEDEDENVMNQVKIQLATNISHNIMRMKGRRKAEMGTKPVECELAANISRQILFLKECRMAREA